MPNPGDIIGGRYQIVHELGSGGFGTTYLTKDNQSPDQPLFVAKQLQPRFNSPLLLESAKQRFATEAMAMQRLGNHSQIPRLIAFFEENQDFYLIQEFIEGEELRREVSRRLFDEAAIIAFLVDTLEILQFVHSQNVIHRDIKPSNLLRRRSDGKIVLIDFGAVKELETLSFGREEAPSLLSSAIGTPGYMAPEQQSGKPAFSSDLYALGRTGIYSLTGQSPLDLEVTVTGESAAWQDGLPVSPALRNILTKMTENRASLRYKSAIEVLQDLKPLQQVGQILAGRYKLLGYLGGRSWTHTYLAEPLQGEISSHCVIKQMRSTMGSILAQQEAEYRFDRELSILRMIGSHPQIPPLLDEFDIDHERYLVQGYIEGQSLTQILQTQKKLSESDIIKLLGDVLEVLEVIHQKQLIHRDVRPSNLIWRASDQKVVLTDFGLVKTLQSTAADQEPPTVLAQPLGSDRYLAPEQLSGRPTYASDLFSLGITAIQGLMGRPPDRLRNRQTGKLLWQGDLNIDPQLALILDKLVHSDLAKRYNSATEALKDVRQLSRKYSSTSRIRGLLSPWQWSLVAIGGVVGLLVAIVYVIQLSQIAFLFRQGDLTLKSGEYQNAINYYNDGLEKSPIFAGKILNFEKAWIQKAYALSALKRYTAMFQACEMAASIKPNSPYPHICKGTALDEMNKPETAIQAYNQAIAVDPLRYEAWHNRGHSYLEMGQSQNAIADFKKAIEVGKEKAQVTWNDLGKLYFQNKDYTQAANAYQAAISLAPNYLPPRIGLGNAEIARQQYENAIDIFNQSLAIDDKSYEAWFGKALAEERLKRYESAFRSYERAIFIKPNYQAAINARQRVTQYLK